MTLEKWWEPLIILSATEEKCIVEQNQIYFLYYINNY